MNSSSWATLCISRLMMGCRATAFSNSLRGNDDGTSTNGANFKTTIELLESPWPRLDCTHVQGVGTEGCLGAHSSAVHDGVVLGLGGHFQQFVLGQRQPDAVAQDWCIRLAGHDVGMVITAAAATSSWKNKEK